MISLNRLIIWGLKTWFSGMLSPYSLLPTTVIAVETKYVLNVYDVQSLYYV